MPNNPAMMATWRPGNLIAAVSLVRSASVVRSSSYLRFRVDDLSSSSSIPQSRLPVCWDCVPRLACFGIVGSELHRCGTRPPLPWAMKLLQYTEREQIICAEPVRAFNELVDYGSTSFLCSPPPTSQGEGQRASVSCGLRTVTARMVDRRGRTTCLESVEASWRRAGLILNLDAVRVARPRGQYRDDRRMPATPAAAARPILAATS